MTDYISFWLAKMAAELMVGVGIAVFFVVVAVAIIGIDSLMKYFKRKRT